MDIYIYIKVAICSLWTVCPCLFLVQFLCLPLHSLDTPVHLLLDKVDSQRKVDFAGSEAHLCSI